MTRCVTGCQALAADAAGSKHSSKFLVRKNVRVRTSTLDYFVNARGHQLRRNNNDVCITGAFTGKLHSLYEPAPGSE